MIDDHGWPELLRQYPTLPADHQAVPTPVWGDLSHMVQPSRPKGVERAVTQYRRREAESIHADAVLEGMSLSAAEVAELISGKHVAGHTAGEQLQVQDLAKASSFMVSRVAEGEPLEPSQALSDDLHMFISQSLNIRTHQFRGDQRQAYDGPKVRLGGGEEFTSLDARLTGRALEEGLDRIRQLDHPVLRGATWAAFATYHQFYFDGNKRAGRYTMNAVLMSHGYDAILIPAAKKAQYEDALIASYRSGDLTPHIQFLLEQYRDD